MTHNDALQGTGFGWRVEVAQQAKNYVTSGVGCAIIVGSIVANQTDSNSTGVEAASYSSVAYVMILGVLAVWQTQRCLAAKITAEAELDSQAVAGDEEQQTADARKQQKLKEIENQMKLHLFLGACSIFVMNLIGLGVYFKQQHE